MIREWLCIATGGALGALLRYGVAHAVHYFVGKDFPWGVFAANALGCLAFGFLATLVDRRVVTSPHLQALLMIGFLGAFTTFSTYAYDTVRLASEGGSWWVAGGNMLLHNSAGVAAVIAGARLARWS